MAERAAAIHPTALREYDVRGTVPETLDEGAAYAVGREGGTDAAGAAPAGRAGRSRWRRLGRSDAAGERRARAAAGSRRWLRAPPRSTRRRCVSMTCAAPRPTA